MSHDVLILLIMHVKIVKIFNFLDKRTGDELLAKWKKRSLEIAGHERPKNL
jgi:hypothetical protein